MTLFITIVGSRKAPANVCQYMAEQSARFQDAEIVVRTGDASQGVDDAVCYPTKYSDSLSIHELIVVADGRFLEVYTARDSIGDTRAHELAEKYHGAWHMCGDKARHLHARNCYQVAGRTLDRPSNLLLCWTPDGASNHRQRSISTGGTGTAISLAADEFNIPVFNLANPTALAKYQAAVRRLTA